MLERLEFGRALTLAENLPPSSRTVSRIEPRAAWSTADYLLAGILDSIALMRYENAGCKGPRPEAVERPKARRLGRKGPRVGRDRAVELLLGKRS